MGNARNIQNSNKLVGGCGIYNIPTYNMEWDFNSKKLGYSSGTYIFTLLKGFEEEKKKNFNKLNSRMEKLLRFK